MKVKKIKAGDSLFYVRNERDLAICEEVCKRKAYLRPRLGFGLSAGERWLDLGANVGAFSVFAASVGCTVKAVEACAENARLVSENLRLNGLFGEVVYGFASNTGEGSTRVVFNQATPGRSGKFCPEGKSTAVEIVQNFDAVSAIESGEFDGVKIDIEGGEFDILEAVREWNVKKVALEYHYRFDKSCANARRRIAGLLGKFQNRSVSKATLEGDVWGGWVDEIMMFWS